MKYATVPFTVPYFNDLIAKSWAKLKNTSSGCIIRSFEVTGIHPLRPPKSMITENLSKGYLSQMQMAPGKKGDEIKTYIDEQSNNVKFNIKLDSNNQVNLHTKNLQVSNRNILIRSAVWDCLSTTTIIPAQQLQKELQEHSNLSKCKVSKSSVLNRQKSLHKSWIVCEWDCSTRGKGSTRKQG